jgi:hypothetical protein
VPALNDEQRKARDLARRALQDCGVVRVTLGQVPLGYRLLQRDGEVTAKRVPGQPDKADVRLKEGTRP